MTKSLENRLGLGQNTLKYQYESAKERMNFHPNTVSESLKIVEDCTHLRVLKRL